MKPVTVEELLRWTYQDQQAHRVETGSLMTAERLANWGRALPVTEVSQTAVVGEICTLGGFVAGGGLKSGALHPDAEIVHETVAGRLLTGRQKGLVLLCALTGGRPDWLPDTPPGRRWEPIEWSDRARTVARYEVRAVYARGSRRKIYDEKVTPVRLVPDPEVVLAARGEYVEWVDALRQVWCALADRGGLRHHRLAAFHLTPLPWPEADTDLWRREARLQKDLTELVNRS